jgi:molybdopterin-guanine dinucleotide biosynthesis protein A
MPPFTAVLLAGGKSTRMGRDKAGVLLHGQPLWQRQLATLRAVQPAELFISGKADAAYAGAGVEIVADNFPGLGPLSGLEATLRRATHRSSSSSPSTCRP